MSGSLSGVLLMGISTLAGADESELCVGQRAHCVLPPAAIVAANATQSAVLPAAHQQDDDPCLLPRALCVLPIAHCVQDSLPRCGGETGAITTLLRRWEAVAANHPAWSARDREWLRRQAGHHLSAHALDLVVRLTQSVTATALLRDFEWQLTPSDDAAILLSAIPRDEATRLFCSELQIELDAITGQLRAVDVLHRTVKHHLVIQPEVTLAANFAVEADDDGDLPPSPSAAESTPLIRFAAGTIEVEVE